MSEIQRAAIVTSLMILCANAVLVAAIINSVPH